MIYQFRNGFHLNGNPQLVGETLENIRLEHEGKLQAKDVVQFAKRATNILHGYFEWDDKEAGCKYRLSQANYLIRAILVCPEKDKTQFVPVRAFVHIEESDEDENIFMSICDVMKDEPLCQQVLDRARKELVVWRNRYRHLAEFAAIFEVIDNHELVPTAN